MQGEALAGAVRSENRKHRTAANLQIEAANQSARPDAHIDAAAFEQRRRTVDRHGSRFSEHVAANEFPAPWRGQRSLRRDSPLVATCPPPARPPPPSLPPPPAHI